VRVNAYAVLTLSFIILNWWPSWFSRSTKALFQSIRSHLVLSESWRRSNIFF